jgi:hypothetical protein
MSLTKFKNEKNSELEKMDFDDEEFENMEMT